MSVGPVDALCALAWAALGLSLVQTLNRTALDRYVVGGMLGQAVLVTAATLIWAGADSSVPPTLPYWLALTFSAWFVGGVLFSQLDIGRPARQVAATVAVVCSAIIVIAALPR